MLKKYFSKIVILSACLISGCGTIDTLNMNSHGAGKCDPVYVYSGLRTDISATGQCISDKFTYSLYPCILITDIPFSLIADTIVLPYTIYKGATVEPSCKKEKT